MSPTLAEERLQHATAYAEITQDRDKKTESVKERRKQFCPHEVEPFDERRTRAKERVSTFAMITPRCLLIPC